MQLSIADKIAVSHLPTCSVDMTNGRLSA
jgi:hypothetical protein